MRRDLNSLARSPFDVLVIGGGIVGACAARDAALRGLSVALIEREDFAGGISWNSLKIIHGGLRSLQSLDIRQARQFVRERRAWLRIAPHLVEPLPFVVPTRGAGRESLALLRAGLALNDVVSRDRDDGLSPSRRLPNGRALAKTELEALVPGLFRAYGGGVLFHDAQLYSAERLVMAVLDDAVRAGAVIANYVEAIAPLLSGESLIGAIAEDRLTGSRFDVRAAMIVNAAGDGAAAVANRLTRREHAVAPMTGIALNLVLEGNGATTAFTLASREDGRLRRLFVVPWRGRTLVGTAHYPCVRVPRSTTELEPYVERFVREAAAAWPERSITRDDVLLVHAGMQPAPHGAPDSKAHGPPEHRIVDHARDGAPRLLTAIGPKLTTSRAVAEQLIDLVCARIGRATGPCETATRLLASAPREDVELVTRRALEGERAGLADDVVTHLVRAYGAGYGALVDAVRGEPALAKRVEQGSPVIAAELRNAAMAEMAMRPGDVITRRTELAATARATSRATVAAADQLRRVASSEVRGSRIL